MAVITPQNFHVYGNGYICFLGQNENGTFEIQAQRVATAAEITAYASQDIKRDHCAVPHPRKVSGS